MSDERFEHARPRSGWWLRTVVGVIRAYQLVLSPLIGPRCRYLPSCSQYAMDAMHEHGVVRGTWLSVRRVLRCHPLGGSGYDPVPTRADPRR